jgi:hypothetical protein
MSAVLMSRRELNRLDVLARLDSDRMAVACLADLTLSACVEVCGQYNCWPFARREDDGGQPPHMSYTKRFMVRRSL